MATPMPDQYAPGEAFPDAAGASGLTRWRPGAQDYAPAAGGAAPWADTAEPAAVPPSVAGAEGPHTRPGWLTAERPDDAA